VAQLHWSLGAQEDLVEIGDFVRRDSVVYAVNLVDRLVGSAERLQTDPLMGRVVPEYSREDLREIIVQSYRMVYLVQRDVVIIVRVVHGARDLRSALGRQPWFMA
jgi:toxin ParE1/3/4